MQNSVIEMKRAIANWLRAALTKFGILAFAYCLPGSIEVDAVERGIH
jgi:hypothetical protein